MQHPPVPSMPSPAVALLAVGPGQMSTSFYAHYHTMLGATAPLLLGVVWWGPPVRK